jgi:hypothetical protein
VGQLNLVRSVLRGEDHKVTARLAFTGALFPHTILELSDALVRPISTEERELVRDELEHQIRGVEPMQRRRTADDGAGGSVTISLDGDLVLEYKFLYRVRPARPGPAISSFPEDMYEPEVINQVATRFRVSVLMAVERISRVLVVQTWQQYDDPLLSGRSVSWNAPPGIELYPTQLNEADINAIREWYERLRSPHVAKIELALKRILRACTERHDPADVLVDSVIAWENLFGTKDGEPTFRITMSLATLLGSSREDRVALKKKLTKIYRLRSDIVHGSAALNRGDYSLCYDALELAISAVRILMSERTDILELSDGAERSTNLLLENSA